MGKKETAEAINEDKKKLKKDKKKRKKQKTDEDHVSLAEKIEEIEEAASNSDRINKTHELFNSDLTESVSANTDGVKSCTSSKRTKKERKTEKKDCILQGEMSDEGGDKGCDEIMAETEENLAASVQNSELDKDEASKKSKKNKKKKKKKERVDDDEQTSSEKIEMEDGLKLKDGDSELVEFDNGDDNVSVVKRNEKSKGGGKKRKQKNELVDSKDMESTCVANDDSPGEEKEEFEEPVKKKKKKKSKEKDKAKNRLVGEKEKPELSEKDDDDVGNQWQCAQFGDTAQKEKFLRLMGANKPSNKQRPASSYSVMAMNRQQEKVLSNSLEKQFLQALQTRKERGLGLGYQ